MGDYREGGWKDKYVVFKRCKDCDGTGGGPCSCGVRSSGDCHSALGHKCRACKGTGVVPADPTAVYFVLRLDEDPHARVAAGVYANSVQRDNPQFARDIRAKLAETHKPEFDV